MTTLNRFPLLGLWAEEAARRLGYRKDDAEALGHAYAVLYAIRARPRVHAPASQPGAPAARAKKKANAHRIHFCGDDIDVAYDVDGRLRGKVGGGRPQTPASYEAAVQAKFPPHYYEEAQKAFRDLMKTFPPRALAGRLVYDMYDQWKKACGVGRLVDLDRLLEWVRRRVGASVRRSA
ncbi:MAG TPA: hypothetical protein VMS17_30200 [Gemmataceae bacterium]|nr:hypothetical protein [Gemmataceae bacterium]